MQLRASSSNACIRLHTAMMFCCIYTFDLARLPSSGSCHIRMAWWLNGRASDSRSEGCVFKSRPGQRFCFITFLCSAKLLGMRSARRLATVICSVAVPISADTHAPCGFACSDTVMTLSTQLVMHSLVLPAYYTPVSMQTAQARL